MPGITTGSVRWYGRSVNDQDDQPLGLGSDLVVTSRVTAEAVVISAVGEVDMATVPQLEQALTPGRGGPDPGTRLILDLTQVSFLGSAGLATVITAATKIDQQGGSLHLVVGHQHAVLRALEITGLDKLLPLHETLDDALTS